MIDTGKPKIESSEIIWTGVVDSKNARIIETPKFYYVEEFHGNSIDGSWESPSISEDAAEIYRVAFLETKKRLEKVAEELSAELNDTQTKLYVVMDSRN